MKEITKVNDGYEVKADAEVFVIPNPASKVCDYTLKSTINKAYDLCKNNGMEFDKENDNLAQFWVVSEDLNSDNLGCHGFRFNADGKKIFSKYIPELIPAKIYKDIKEGETKQVVYNIKGEIYPFSEENEDVNIKLILNVTAAQEKYRYRNFGKFEEALMEIGA